MSKKSFIAARKEYNTYIQSYLGIKIFYRKFVTLFKTLNIHGRKNKKSKIDFSTVTPRLAMHSSIKEYWKEILSVLLNQNLNNHEIHSRVSLSWKFWFEIFFDPGCHQEKNSTHLSEYSVFLNFLKMYCILVATNFFRFWSEIQASCSFWSD